MASPFPKVLKFIHDFLHNSADRETEYCGKWSSQTDSEMKNDWAQTGRRLSPTQLARTHLSDLSVQQVVYHCRLGDGHRYTLQPSVHCAIKHTSVHLVSYKIHVNRSQYNWTHLGKDNVISVTGKQ